MVRERWRIPVSKARRAPGIFVEVVERQSQVLRLPALRSGRSGSTAELVFRMTVLSSERSAGPSTPEPSARQRPVAALAALRSLRMTVNFGELQARVDWMGGRTAAGAGAKGTGERAADVDAGSTTASEVRESWLRMLRGVRRSGGPRPGSRERGGSGRRGEDGRFAGFLGSMAAICMAMAQWWAPWRRQQAGRRASSLDLKQAASGPKPEEQREEE